MDKRTPLRTPAHDIDDTLLPGSQRHDVNCKVEPHAWGKAEDRRVTKDHRLEAIAFELPELLFDVQLALGIERLRTAFVGLDKMGLLAVTVDRRRTRIHIPAHACSLCRPG